MPVNRLEEYMAPGKCQYLSTVIIIKLNDEHEIPGHYFSNCSSRSIRDHEIKLMVHDQCFLVKRNKIAQSGIEINQGSLYVVKVIIVSYVLISVFVCVCILNTG